MQRDSISTHEKRSSLVWSFDKATDSKRETLTLSRLHTTCRFEKQILRLKETNESQSQEINKY